MGGAAPSRHRARPVHSAKSACIRRSTPPISPPPPTSPPLLPSLHPSSMPNLTVGSLIRNSVSQAVLSSCPNIHLLYVYLHLCLKKLKQKNYSLLRAACSFCPVLFLPLAWLFHASHSYPHFFSFFYTVLPPMATLTSLLQHSAERLLPG